MKFVEMFDEIYTSFKNFLTMFTMTFIDMLDKIYICHTDFFSYFTEKNTWKMCPL